MNIVKTASLYTLSLNEVDYENIQNFGHVDKTAVCVIDELNKIGGLQVIAFKPSVSPYLFLKIEKYYDNLETLSIIQRQLRLILDDLEWGFLMSGLE